jgi:hypothetical protein
MEMTDDGRFLSFRSRGPFREKNLSIPAAAGSFSLDASSGLLANRRFGAELFFFVLSFCGVSVCYEE